MDGGLVQEKLVHNYVPGHDICVRLSFQASLQVQRMHVKQRILTTMADEQTVYFYMHRQVFFAFICAVQKFWRLVERGEVQPSQIYVHVRALIDQFNAFLQYGRAVLGRGKYHCYSN